MHTLIEQAVANPFAGALFTLRQFDPLWQAEIGVERNWEVRAGRETCGCDCPHCDSTVERRVKVMAITAREAIEAVQADLDDGWFVEGVRPVGSTGAFAYIDDVLEA